MNIDHSMMDKKKIKEFLRCRKGKIYFIGICGVSMRSLAQYCSNIGFSVAGSDIACADAESLRMAGIRIYSGRHRGKIMEELPDLAVYTVAIAADDPELMSARKNGIPCISRADLLGAIISEYDLSVGVIGTHGKSTVSAMVYSIFSFSGIDTGAFIGACGADVPSFNKGDGSVLVYEGCEYRDSFLRFEPTVNIVTSVDYDHTDYFPDRNSYRASFLKAADLSREFTLINADDEGARSLLGALSCKTVAFSRDGGFDYRYSLNSDKGRYSVTIYNDSVSILSYTLRIPGEHNAGNSVSAAILAYELGISAENIAGALEGFSGIGRRLELIGSRRGIPIYYDYAHHPTEICALKNALSDMGYEKVAAVFAPHTYTRTRDFFVDIASALAGFSVSLITEIYGAREHPIIGVSSSALAEKIRSIGSKALAVTQKEAINILLACDCDCIALVGAGELDLIKKEIEEI